ncbi:hypothetical protein B7463_g11192, partial [Scytalidium lignicola]
MHILKQVYTSSVNDSKYSTAAAWVQEHMLEEPVCEKCAENPNLKDEDRLSVQEIATFIQDLGIPDALAGSKPIIRDDQPWEETLSGNGTPLQCLDRCRHIRFGEAIHAQGIELFIAFSRMPIGKETFLIEEQHTLWIDGVVLPSLRNILPRTSMQHFPATWAIGARKMRAKHNEHRTWDVGGTHPIHYPVQEAFVPGLWEAMLSRLSDPCLALFRRMFIVIQIYGTKLVWNNSSFSALCSNMLAELDNSINRAYLIREKAYFDVGKETISKSAWVHWRKMCCLKHWLASVDPKTYVGHRVFPVSGTRDAATMSIESTQKHFLHLHVVHAKRYNSYKELVDAGKIFPFTNRNIESMLVPTNLLQLWAKAGGAPSRSKYVEHLVTEAGKRSYSESKKRSNLAFSGSQGESFGTREEYRMLLEVVEVLDLDSQPCRLAEPLPYYSVPLRLRYSYVASL